MADGAIAFHRATNLDGGRRLLGCKRQTLARFFVGEPIPIAHALETFSHEKSHFWLYS
jgi:hypothetical protein